MPETEHTPLTEEELQAIRETAETTLRHDNSRDDNAQNVLRLVAEVERLQKKLKEARALARSFGVARIRASLNERNQALEEVELMREALALVVPHFKPLARLLEAVMLGPGELRRLKAIRETTPEDRMKRVKKRQDGEMLDRNGTTP